MTQRHPFLALLLVLASVVVVPACVSADFVEEDNGSRLRRGSRASHAAAVDTGVRLDEDSKEFWDRFLKKGQSSLPPTAGRPPRPPRPSPTSDDGPTPSTPPPPPSSSPPSQSSSGSLPPFKGTTLERLITRAFNARIQDGTWIERFGLIPNVDPQPTCGGTVDDWPISQEDGDGDLLQVLESGVFKCGHIRNSKYVTGGNVTSVTLLETSDTSASGAIADFFDDIVGYAGSEMGNRRLQVEWLLFDNAQETFDALQDGTIDAACGYWSGEASWDPSEFDVSGGSSEGTLSRAYYFNPMACRTFVQQKYLYAPFQGPEYRNFDELIQRGVNGRGNIRNVCVSGNAGGGFESDCQTTFNRYTDLVTCTGVGTGTVPFEFLEAGDCEAVWDGAPPEPDLFQAVEFPYLYAPVTYFRPTELVFTSPPTPPRTNLTTLEVAMTRSFDYLVATGDWDDVFGRWSRKIVAVFGKLRELART